MNPPIMHLLARTPFMEMFEGKPLSFKLEITTSMWISRFDDKTDIPHYFNVSFETSYGSHGGTVHLVDMPRVEIYF